MKKFLLSACAAAAIFASPAIAADIPLKSPAYKAAPIFNWTGWYGGINGGYGWDPQYFYERPPGTLNQILILEPQGGLGGLQIGYNWQVSPIWVVGVEADFQFTGIKDTYNFDYPGGGASSATLHLRHFATLRGRFGYAMDRSLIFVTAGAAAGDFQANALINADNHVGAISGNRWIWGYVVGAGFERAFANNWTLKFEYLYIDFAHLDIRGLDDGGGPIAITGDPYLHIIRLGLNLRFATGG